MEKRKKESYFFLAEVFLVAGFLAAAFFGAAFLGAGFLATVFFGVAVLLMPAAVLLRAASWRFFRATLFLCMTFFLAALSKLLWALEWAAAVFFLSPLVMAVCSDFRALLSERLVLLLRTAAFVETRTRFLADLIMGIVDNPYVLDSSKLNYSYQRGFCKENNWTGHAGYGTLPRRGFKNKKWNQNKTPTVNR